EEALRRHARNREMPLGQVLAEMGVVKAEAVNSVMASKLGIPVVNLRQFAISQEALSKVTPQTAHRFSAVPLFISDGALVIATENPLSMGHLEQLRFATDMRLLPVMASREDLRFALDL